MLHSLVLRVYAPEAAPTEARPLRHRCRWAVFPGDAVDPLARAEFCLSDETVAECVLDTIRVALHWSLRLVGVDQVHVLVPGEMGPAWELIQKWGEQHGRVVTCRTPG